MKRALKYLVTLALLASALVSARERAPEGVLEARAAAVTLGDFDADGVFRRYCSGAIVGTRIITAGHCVEGTSGALVQFFDGYITRAKLLDAKYAWPTNDYGVLDMPAQLRSRYGSLERGNGLELGESVFAWSGPWGLGMLLLDGSYAGRLAMDDSVPESARGFMYATMNGAGGSSGSVILNERGQAEAILVGAFGQDSRSLRLTGSLLVKLP